MDKPKFIIEKSNESSKKFPRFLISKKTIFKQIEILKEIFDEVSYSYKTNPTIGNILNENESCYQSVHSTAELEMLRNKNKIWYFPIALNEKTLEILFNKYKIKNYIVDNQNDLKLLLNYIEKKSIKINLLLRMKLKENTLFTGKHYVFGMRVKEIQQLIPMLKEKKNIEKLGIHFHRKTQNVSEWSLKNEIEQSLGDRFLSQIDIINLGGGLPGNYKNIHDKALESIFTKIKELKNYTDKFNIKLIIEPGRFIASPSVKLESNIIAINENTLFLDVSIFNGMLDTVIANIKLNIKNELEKGQAYTLKGCTPDSSDILRYRVYLDNPKVGDKITFLGCGAYTYTTNFCALPKIDEVIVEYF